MYLLYFTVLSFRIEVLPVLSSTGPVLAGTSARTSKSISGVDSRATTSRRTVPCSQSWPVNCLNDNLQPSTTTKGDPSPPTALCLALAHAMSNHHTFPYVSPPAKMGGRQSLLDRSKMDQLQRRTENHRLHSVPPSQLPKCFPPRQRSCNMSCMNMETHG